MQRIYPKFNDAVVEGVPEQPNVEFTFTVKAPKKYVFETWNLPKEQGGEVKVLTPGHSTADAAAWQGVAEDMERDVSGVVQVVGNVRTPAEGPWHIEWKAGAPYYQFPFPVSFILTAMWGKATFADGPGSDETTISVSNHFAVGLSTFLTSNANIVGAKQLVTSKAPQRFKNGQFDGPIAS